MVNVQNIYSNISTELVIVPLCASNELLIITDRRNYSQLHVTSGQNVLSISG